MHAGGSQRWMSRHIRAQVSRLRVFTPTLAGDGA